MANQTQDLQGSVAQSRRVLPEGNLAVIRGKKCRRHTRTIQIFC